MRKLISLMMLWILFLLPVSARAEANFHLSLVTVDIWPEYDQSAILFIYHISLVPGTNLPAKLSLRLPLGAEINAVAIEDESGNLIDEPYDNTPQAQWSLLTLTTISSHVQVEYYKDLEKVGSARHIVFNWDQDYPVDELEVNFLRPLGADNVSLSLPPVDTSPGQNGLLNYRVNATNIVADQPFSLTIDYQRQTDALSISSLPVEAASTPGPDTPGHVSMTGIMPWALAAIGLLLVVFGFFGFVAWQRGGQISKPVKQKQPPQGDNEEMFIYCHQCGKRARPGDIFCRTCGTRLKKVVNE